MADGYRIFGAEMSPYSVKVRSYFRYKQIPHEWIVRNASSQAEYQKYAKLPIIPLVVTPDGDGMQDSTPIIDASSSASRAVDPSRRPDRRVRLGAARGVRRRVGQQMDVPLPLGARRRSESSAGAHRALRCGRAPSEREHAAFAAQIRARMVDRVWFVGSNEKTAPQIEAVVRDALGLLDSHLATRPYLFGGAARVRRLRTVGPALRAWTDPTPGALIEGARRMCWTGCTACCGRRPKASSRAGPARTDADAAPRRAGRAAFLPWTLANATALAEGEEEFSVTLGGHLDAEAAEISRAVARRCARNTLGSPTRTARYGSGRGGLPCRIARLDTRLPFRIRGLCHGIADYKTALIVGAGGPQRLAGAAVRREGMRVALAARKIEKLGALCGETGARALRATPPMPTRSSGCSGWWRADRRARRRRLQRQRPRPGAFIDLEPADVAQAIAVSAFGGFLVAQQAVQRMLPNKHGAILFTGASASVKGYAHSAPFAMGKFALRGLAQSMARELRRRAFTSRISSSTAASATPRAPSPPTSRIRCSIPTRSR